MKEKEIKLNYTISLNDYYERIFHIPEKLKKIPKEERCDNLRERLMKLHSKFYSKNPRQKGVLLPVQHKSSMVTTFIIQGCWSVLSSLHHFFHQRKSTLQNSLRNSQSGRSQCFRSRRY